MQTNKNEIVLSAIKSGLRAFYELAHLKIYRGSWYKKMTRAQQLQVGRALFTLREVAAAPEKHFSRPATEAAWIARGKEYAKSHGIAEGWSAYYIVSSPADIVHSSTEAAFWGDCQLRARLYNFCDAVQDWYYDSTSRDGHRQGNVERDVERIVEMSKRIVKECDIAKDGRAVHYINRFLENQHVQRLLVTGYAKQK